MVDTGLGLETSISVPLEVQKATARGIEISHIRKRLASSCLSESKQKKLEWLAGWLRRKNGEQDEQKVPTKITEVTAAYRFDPWDRKLRRTEVFRGGDPTVFLVQGATSSHGFSLEIEEAAELRLFDSQSKPLPAEQFLERIADYRRRGRFSFI